MTLDFSDELLCKHLDRVISSILPHENYDSANFGIVYSSLKETLNTDEVTGLRYVFYVVFDKYLALSNVMNHDKFKVRITREHFINSLENNLPDLILDTNTDIENILAQDGKNSDLSIPTVQQEAMSTLFIHCMELYDACFELKCDRDEGISALVDLADAKIANLIQTGMNTMRAVVSVGESIKGKVLKGTSGWLAYTKDLLRIIEESSIQDDGDLICDNVSKSTLVDQACEEIHSAIGSYNIPQIDDYTPVLSHRLTVLVAGPNVGKTTFIICLIASLIRNGVKCMFACGESSKEAILNKIVSSYIFQEYDMSFEPKYLYGEGFQSLSQEDKQLVSSAKARVLTSGLVITTNLSYDTVSSKMTHYYNNGCRAFFIDHTMSLMGGNMKAMPELVSNLAIECRDFKRQYPVYIMLASQPSSNLKDIFQKDVSQELQITVTAQSSTPHQEADELFILFKNDRLTKIGLLGLKTQKRRDAPIPPVLYLKKEFALSSYVYDAKHQGANGADAGMGETLLANIGTVEFDDGEDYGDMDIEF